MRRTTGTVLLVAVLALAGCSSPDGNTMSEAKPSPTPTIEPGEKFVAAVIDAHLDSYSTGVPAADELRLFPPEWCSALGGGHSVEWMLGDGGLYPVGQEWGTEKSDAYELLVLGVESHCPKYLEAVLEELRASGEY
ncbi:hypothetical protein [Streptomyces sp. NBC_00620]|uniref:hypothetical protein n=1 Tax=unclassified Streptomyces TaxID=2593676 RepID=UPI00224E315D|nr:hypothetical protein [Streptomyces sp. NBC_00620]MCX4973280.1 hypothetical protein [Streptomyces sp. NBC_00620]WUC12304.1 hypothetical protein OG256_21510 [Streptomyces sp. NBC_00564]WUC51152.1 hypothetical protein OG266_23300 [Streptomyces sp. NBC_00554]